MNKPTIGRIVIYNTTEADRKTFKFPGNVSNDQEQLPAVIVAVWSETVVNLQVFLDGSGTVWKTSVVQGTAAGNWNWPVIER